MTYAKYARRTCVCGHDISEHLLIKGSCKKCHLAPKTEVCIQFTSQDGFSAHRAQVWGRRFHSPMWWVSSALLLACLFFAAHSILVVSGPMPWWLHLLRVLGTAVVLYKLGKRAGRLFGRLRGWIDKQVEDRPYDDLQLKRIEKESEK